MTTVSRRRGSSVRIGASCWDRRRWPVNATIGFDLARAAAGSSRAPGSNWNSTSTAASDFSEQRNVGGDSSNGRCASAITPACASTCRHRRPRRRPPAARRESAADGEGALRTVHGGGRQELDGHGRRGRIRTATRSPTSGRRRRHAGEPGRSADAVDGAEAGRPGAGDGHGRRRQGRHGDGHGHHSGGPAAGEGVHVRGRALRLRPLHAAAGSDAGARRSGARRCRRTRRCGSRSKATRATSARPNTTWRSASVARTRCATTWSAAASAPTGCGRSATARSGRSTTTPAKRRAA